MGVEAAPSKGIDFVVLGDLFFHSKTIIFDKKKNQIGFISNDKPIKVYPDNDLVYFALDVIALLGLVSAVFILMMRKKPIRTIAELSERLQNGAEY